MRKVLVFALVAIALYNTSLAQEKSKQYRESLWIGYFNQTRMTQYAGLWAEAQLRFNDDFARQLHTTLARVGYVHYFSERARLAAGYAFVTVRGSGGGIGLTEHRPWQQFQWLEKKNHFLMMQWIRLEQRYTAAAEQDFNFLSHRVRYNISLTIPLGSKEIQPKSPFIFTSNEVFINFGKNIVNNYFDQNRFFAGFGYQFTTKLNAQLGYLYVFQQQPEGNRYIHTDAIRFYVFHNLDLRSDE
jgi:hypothetical protein